MEVVNKTDTATTAQEDKGCNGAVAPSVPTTSTQRKNVCISPQSRTLLVAAADNDNCINIWEVEAGSTEVVLKQQIRPACEYGSVGSLCIDISGSLLAVGIDESWENRLLVWDLTAAELLFNFDEYDCDFLYPLRHPTFTKDGQRVAVAALGDDINGFVFVLDAISGDLMCAIHGDSSHSINSFVFVDKDRRILTGAYTWGSDPSFGRCWCAFTGEIQNHWIGSQLVTHVFASPVADTIFYGSYPYSLKPKHRYSCRTAEGTCRSGECNLAHVTGFVDESHVVTIDTVGRSVPIIELLDLETGSLSKTPAKTARCRFLLSSSRCAVANGAGKVLLAHKSSINVISTQQAEIGDVVVVIEDPCRISITCLYGVELKGATILL
jgi:hypothetical protein